MADRVDSMRVLVTRPLADSRRTAIRLAERGHEAIIAPLFEVRIFAGPELELAGVQAVLTTSANGVRALAQRSKRRDIKLLAVGSETAAVARRHGFSDVADASGDSKALARLACALLRPGEGAVLHARGVRASTDLASRLSDLGFFVGSSELYETVDAPELPEFAAVALREGTLDAVLLFSPHSAQLLLDRVRRAGLSPACKRLHACCISAAAAKELEDVVFAGIHIAANPDQDSLLAVLDAIDRPGVDIHVVRSK